MGERAAATGAAIGAGFGGAEGLLIGTSASRSQLESRIRDLLCAKMLLLQPLTRGMFADGLVCFPAVNMRNIRVIFAEADDLGVLDINIPVVMAIQAVPAALVPN